MALLFISHSSADDDVASSLRHAPLEREVRSMFLDFDPQRMREHFKQEFEDAKDKVAQMKRSAAPTETSAQAHKPV